MVHPVVVMYSAGAMSWAAAQRAVTQHGLKAVHLLFADTLIEDEDSYRFLVESAAKIAGVWGPVAQELAAQARAIPAVEDDRWDERVAQLAEIRTAMASLVPMLTWLCDGRSPWDVFLDEKFVGNSRVDPCSKILKRQLMDQWVTEHCNPAQARLVFGLDWSERGRIEGDGKKKLGVRKRFAARGWTTDFPMNCPPYQIKSDLINFMKSIGIEPPRLYDLGWNHGNCGGFCVKAGLGQIRHLRAVMPARYAWHARREREAIIQIGGSARPFSVTRKGGKRVGISMDQIAAILDADPQTFADYGGGCGGGCAVDDPEDAGSPSGGD